MKLSREHSDKERARRQADPARSSPSLEKWASTLPPIFMKRDESNTFKSMKFDQISSIVNELELKYGHFEKMSIAQEGDLIIRPWSIKQQDDLLKTTASVLNDTI